MTTLYFAGAEQPSHRNLLADCGVTRFAINLTNINRLVRPTWDVRKHLPAGAEWIAYADQATTWEEAEPFIRQGPDMTLGPMDWAEQMDSDDFEPDKFAPYWEDVLDQADWDAVALTDDMVKNQSTLRRILAGWTDAQLIAVTGANRGVERLDAVVSSAWIAAQKFGETQVWTGNKLHRYPGARKTDARPKHRSDIERLGIDYERVLANDPTETARLAIVSWQGWEDRHGTVLQLASSPPLSDQDGMGSAHPTLASARAPTGHSAGTPREKVMLPVMALEQIEEVTTDGQGVQHQTLQDILHTVPDSFRQCNNCFLASRCPEAQPNASCAYSIPVKLTGKDQLQGLMRAVVEMQAQRVMFARFSEQTDGQGIDPTLSAEIDRLFNILAKMKDISDTRDLLKIELEARGNSGMLSRIFGADVGEKARALSMPMTSDEALHQLDPDPVL